LYEAHGQLVTLHHGGSVETGKYGYVEFIMECKGCRCMVFRTRPSFRKYIWTSL
jgi:hypothetical protein